MSNVNAVNKGTIGSFHDASAGAQKESTHPHLNCPLVTIIMVVYSNREVISHGLTVIDNTEYNNVEVIIVDNFGNDGSMEIVSNWVANTKVNVKIINGSVDHCLAKAENSAIALSRGKYILPLNPDNVFLAKNWLTLLVKTLETMPFAMVACPTVLNHDLKTIQTTGTKSHFHTYCSNNFVGMMYECVMDLPIIEVNNMPIGSTYLWRRDVGMCVGGYDEYFCPTMFEETDLFWRIGLIGGKIYWVPNSIIAHVGGYSFGMESRDHRIWSKRQSDGFKHAIRSTLKNSRILAIPIELVLLLFPALSYNPYESLVLFLKAIRWNITMIDDIAKRRRELFKMLRYYHAGDVNLEDYEII